MVETGLDDITIERNGHVIICGPDMRVRTVDGNFPPHITEVLRDTDLSHKFLGIDPYYADRGHAVHLACKLINEGVLDEESITDEIRGFVMGYRLWIKESSFNHECSELPLYSTLHDYCGTLDLVGSLPKIGRVVIDIKTSFALDPAVEIQVGAQAILWNDNFKTKPLAGRYVLQLKADGTYRLKDISKIDQFLFLDALRLWRWKKTHKRKDKLAVAVNG